MPILGEECRCFDEMFEEEEEDEAPSADEMETGSTPHLDER